MKSSLRFRLHASAIEAHKNEPPPPVLLNKDTRREHREAVKQHYQNALMLALQKTMEAPPIKPSAYTVSMWNGIIRLLKGQNSYLAKPLLPKTSVMPHMREWAAKRGLI